MDTTPTPPDAGRARGLWLEYALDEDRRMGWLLRERVNGFLGRWLLRYGTECPLTVAEMVAALAQVADLADQGEAR